MRSAPSTCLVTGTRGYLGSRVKSALERRGWQVVELTRRPAAGSTGVAFQLGEGVRASALAGAGALVHCAYDFTERTWPAIHRTNVAGSEALLRAARQAGIENLIYISSISAFEGCRSLYGRAKLETELIAQSLGATVIRPGLIWGDPPGAMFGSLVKQVSGSPLVPLIGGGTQVQYLVHEDDIVATIGDCLERTIAPSSAPITVAHDRPWTFREILQEIGVARSAHPRFVPVPWRAVWAALKGAELVGLKPAFRSDSLISLMYQNPSPSFEPLRSLGVRCRPFRLAGDASGRR